MIQRHRNKGFTLIELMLAMAFISVLLLSIAMTSIQVGKLYNRGLVLQSVNQAGRHISDTMRRDFLQANAQLIFSQSGSDVTNSVINIPATNPRSGRMCLGQYSYIWNYAPFLNSTESDTAIVKDTDGEPINLIRVADENGSMCSRDKVTDRYPRPNDDMKSTVLLKKPSNSRDVVLGVHDVRINRLISQERSGEALYDVGFMIGTSDTDVIVDGQCKPPSDNTSNMEFCAINQFQMIVRTNG